jgi:hypothetical protein
MHPKGQAAKQRPPAAPPTASIQEKNMNRSFASALAYFGSVAAATLAAALMSGYALAEGPVAALLPFAGVLI